MTTLTNKVNREPTLRSKGAAGPSSQTDAENWRRILVSKLFGNKSNDLAKAVACALTRATTSAEIWKRSLLVHWSPSRKIPVLDQLGLVIVSWSIWWVWSGSSSHNGDFPRRWNTGSPSSWCLKCIQTESTDQWNSETALRQIAFADDLEMVLVRSTAYVNDGTLPLFDPKISYYPEPFKSWLIAKVKRWIKQDKCSVIFI